jgi:hypothetical protein
MFVQTFCNWLIFMHGGNALATMALPLSQPFGQCSFILVLHVLQSFFFPAIPIQVGEKKYEYIWRHYWQPSTSCVGFY